MTSRAMAQILDKIGSADKDFRYMAVSDLLSELSKASGLEASVERKVATAVMERLDDASGDVSALAVKCLGPLVRTGSDTTATSIAKGLCEGLVSGKEQRSDACAIALKTVLTELPAGKPGAAPKAMLAPLCTAVADSGLGANALIECLDVLQALLERFGAGMERELESTRGALMPLLDASRAPVRKRAAGCIAVLAAHLPPAALAEIVGDALRDLAPGSAAAAAGTRVLLVGAIVRAVGSRFGAHLAEALPALAACARSSGEGTEEDELRESALLSIEAMVHRCPTQAAALGKEALCVALEMIKYDPNYDDDGADDMSEDGDEGDEEDDEYEDDYDSDDEDTSWKARRASARCAAAVFASLPQVVAGKDDFHDASERLIGRFRDREEVVRLQVFETYGALLACAGKGNDLAAEVPALVKVLSRQMRETKPKEIKARVGAFSLLAAVSRAAPGALAEHVGVLLEGTAGALAEQDGPAAALEVKVEALGFAEALLRSHAAADVQPHLGVLMAPLCSAAGERYYKVSAAALACLAEALKAMRAEGASPPTGDLAACMPGVADVVAARMAAADQDLEVKERAINAASVLVGVLGDLPAARAGDMLEALLQKLGNEVTRLAAVRAITRVAESPLAIDLSAVSGRAAAALSPLVRQADHAVRAAALQALIALAAAAAGAPPAEAIAEAVEESAALIVADDLNLAAAALRLCVTALKAAPAVSPSVVGKALKPALELARSPLLQGAALRALQAFFAALATVNAPEASFDALHSQLMAAARAAVTAAAGSGGAAAASAAGGAARCAAGLCVAAGAERCTASVATLQAALKDGGEEVEVLLALLCLGELGRRVDVTTAAAEAVAAELTTDRASESVKAAASFALGGIAAGNPAAYLPFIFQRVGDDAKLNYLLLQALREVIMSQSSVQGPAPAAVAGEPDDATPPLSEVDVQSALQLLLRMCESEEEGVRNVVAECLGKLGLLAPDTVMPVLATNAGASQAALRYAAASASRYVFVDRATLADAQIEANAPTLLGLMGDDDRHVRRAAVLALSSAAHNKSAMTLALLPSLLPTLYEQTVIRKDMIRIVDLGPFKHTIDDGLELRKASFECLDTLLASPTLAALLEPAPLLQALASALDDAHEIKLFAHITLERLARTRPADVAEALPSLCEPLGKTFAARLKSDAVKQEVDRHEDMLNGAARCVAAIECIDDLVCTEFTEMVTKAQKNAAVAPRIQQARQALADGSASRAGGDSASAMDTDD